MPVPKLCYEGVNDSQSADLCLEGYNRDDCVHLLRQGCWADCKSGKLHERFKFIEERFNYPSISEGEEIVCPWCGYRIDDYYELKDGTHECSNCHGEFELSIECIRRCTTYKR